MYDARCHPSSSIPGPDISLCPSCLCTVEWVRLADVLGEVYALVFHCDYPKTTFLQLRLPDPTTYHIPPTSFHQVSSCRTQNPSLPRQYTSEDSLVSATGDRRPVSRRLIPTASLDPTSHGLIPGASGKHAIATRRAFTTWQLGQARAPSWLAPSGPCAESCPRGSWGWRQ